MQALASAPVDILPTPPQAPSRPAKTDNDDRFATHLKSAARNKLSAKRPERIANKKPDPPAASEQAPPEAKTANDATKDAAAVDGKNPQNTGTGSKQTASGNEQQAAAAAGSQQAMAGDKTTQQSVEAVTAVKEVASSQTPQANPNESTLVKILTAITQAAAAPVGAATATLPKPADIDSTLSAGPVTPGGLISTQPAPTMPAAATPAAAAEVPAVQPAQPLTVAGHPVSVTFQAQTGQPTLPIAEAPPPVASLTAQTSVQTASQTSTQITAQQQNSPQIVQNTFGEVLTIYKTAETKESDALPANGETSAVIATPETLPKGLGASMIHPQMPQEKGKSTGGETTSQQHQETSKETSSLASAANASKGIQGEANGLEGQPQPHTFASVGLEAQSLGQAQAKGPAPLNNNTAATESSPFKLPSGATVPGQTVVDQIAAHFSMNQRLETSTVRLRLSPQELGEVRMEIKVSQDSVRAHIIAQTPQAQAMIDQHLPRLRQSLEEQGLHLGQVDVSLAAHDQASGERFQDQAAWQQPHQTLAATTSSVPFSLTSDEILAETASPASTTLSVHV